MSFTEAQWPALGPLRQQRTTLILHRDADEVPEVLKDACHCRTLVLLPMLSKGQVFGMMGVSFPNESEPVSERRIGMLSGIGHQIAAAIDNSRLSAARQEEAWVSAVLLQVADATSRVQPIGVTLEQAAHLTPLLAGVDRCVVLVRDDEGNFVARAVHSERPELEQAYRGAIIEPGELPLLDDAIRLGQPMVVDETMESDRVPAPWRERYGSRALLVVPMSVSDEVIGALLADDVGAAHRFSPRRVRILSGIAAQTAMAIENARLQTQEAERVRLARELELAQSIQRSLLPQEVPQLRGYEIVYRWRAAREVGGDFFDFIPFSSGSLGLLVADVSDKGIPAALYMMFARTVLRAVALSGREPMVMLARSNDLMVADSTAEMFVTAYYSILNPRSHTLTYASGGHNLALYAGTDDSGPACPLITNGLALGILSPVEFQQKTLLMAPGDVVLFYTDGLNEALNRSGDAFGDDRLASLLAEVRHLPAEGIAEAIESALSEFVGDISQYDDLTLIVLKRNEPDDNRSA